MNEGPSADAFSLRDVAADALASMRSDWRAHAGWNVIWVALAGVSCCGFTMLLGGAAGAMGMSQPGADPSARVEDLTRMVIVVYAVVLPLMLGLYAVHQSVTMTLVSARGKGTPLSMSEAVQRGLSRTPALVGHMLLRLLVEGVPLLIFYGVVFGILWGVMGTTGNTMRDLGPAEWGVLAVGYVVVLVYGFAVRGFIGLAFACVVAGAGPVASFGESVRLLSGRRWQFIRLRLVVLASWTLAYATCMGPFMASSLASAGHPNPMVSLLLLPLMLGFYGVMLFLIVADAAIEATYHARITRPLDTAALAATFA